VPGWFLASTEGTFAAYRDDQERLVARLAQGTTGQTFLEIPAGRWRLHMDVDRDDATLEVKRGEKTVASATGRSLEFDSDGGEYLIEVRPTGRTLIGGLDLRLLSAEVAEEST